MLKRFIIFTLLCLIPLPALAAMDCVFTSSKILSYSSVSGGVYETLYTCTFDGTPGTASDVLTAEEMGRIEGSWLYRFTTKNGSTGPTDDSDLSVIDSSGTALINVAGNGANVIDNAVKNLRYFDPVTSGTDDYNEVNPNYPWTIAVTNNAVSNSSFVFGVISCDN